MNEDQEDGLNSSSFWRDRNDKESKEKRIEAKKMMRELIEWWAEKDRWDQFVKSYPSRFTHLLYTAAIKGKVSVIQDSNDFCFTDSSGVKHELGLVLPKLPEWSIKETFDKLEADIVQK